jgi:hypothetical protein
MYYVITRISAFHVLTLHVLTIYALPTSHTDVLCNEVSCTDVSRTAVTRNAVITRVQAAELEAFRAEYGISDLLRGLMNTNSTAEAKQQVLQQTQSLELTTATTSAR